MYILEIDRNFYSLFVPKSSEAFTTAPVLTAITEVSADSASGGRVQNRLQLWWPYICLLVVAVLMAALNAYWCFDTYRAEWGWFGGVPP